MCSAKLVWCAGLQFFSVFARVFIAVHCIAKSRCCVCNAYLCLVGCNQRARLSLRASGRTLVLLHADGWKYQFNAKDTDREKSLSSLQVIMSGIFQSRQAILTAFISGYHLTTTAFFLVGFTAAALYQLHYTVLVND